MKRCPTCNKTFTDETLSFCLEDGTPLVSIPSDDEAQPRTIAYQPPGGYIPPGRHEKRRVVWPWVLGIVGLLVLAMAGLVIAAVFLIPRMASNEATRNKESDNGNPVIESNANNSAKQNSNVPEANRNAETDAKVADSRLNSPPPSDKELVLTQLTDLEHEWTVANLNADKKKLDQILADDYVGPAPDGKMQGKADYLQNIQPDKTVQKWEFKDLKLTLHGDRATLFGKIQLLIQDSEVSYDFVDRFVWREGRWQATGSEVKLSE
jgi:Domain of unknown function (DUF4440)